MVDGDAAEVLHLERQRGRADASVLADLAPAAETRSVRWCGMLSLVSGLIVQNYSDEDQTRWDAFVANSNNGTFLFQRGYVDYHSDRFPDASLIVTDEHGAIRALLPATRRGHDLISHEGLTYGGFVTDRRMTAEIMLDLLAATTRHLRAAGITTLIYKSVPHIYHRSPAEEDLYALFLHGAELYRRDLLSVLDYGAEFAWEDRWRWRMRKAGKAVRAGFEVRTSDEYDRFWPLLTSNLEARHGVTPVHSLDEITLLAGRFPEQIQLFGAYRGDSLEAGAVTYLTETVCHAQYSASSDQAREVRGLDLVFAHIIDSFRGRARFFDFGISTEQGGHAVNQGLLAYKQRFGARAVMHDFYRLTLADE